MADTPAQTQEDPSASWLKKLDGAADPYISKALGIPQKEASEKLHPLTPAQRKQLQEIEEHAISTFHGDLTQLEAALGMLRMGHHFGWKVLYVIHSKKTIRNYESILGIQIRDVFEAEGPSSYRSVGFNIANRFKNFWKTIGGEVKIPHRQNSL